MPISAIASGPLSTTPAAEHSTQKGQQQRQAEYRRSTYIVVAYIVVAYIVMAEYRRCTYIVVAYIVVAYIVMAEYRRCRPKAPRLWVPTAAAPRPLAMGAYSCGPKAPRLWVPTAAAPRLPGCGCLQLRRAASHRVQLGRHVRADVGTQAASVQLWREILKTCV